MYLILTVLWPFLVFVGLLHSKGLKQWDCQEGNGQSTCNALVPFLIFNNGNDIFSIDIDGTHLRKVVAKTGSSVLLDFDSKEQRLYWLDRKRGFIERIYLNGTKRERLRAVGKGSAGFAVDWIHNLIFWSNLQRGTIKWMNMIRKKSRILLRGLFNPTFIVVDPVEGCLFWCSEDPQGVTTIQKANLSGNNVTSVIEMAGEIKSLTLDLTDKKIYWITFKRETGDLNIWSCTYNGESTTTVKYLGHSSRQSIFGLSLFSDHVYYSEWKSGSIRRIEKHTGKDTVTIILQPFPSVLEIGHIKVVPALQYSSTSDTSDSFVSRSCSLANNACSAVCVKVAGRQQCKCAEGFALSADGKHCEDTNECAMWNHGCTLGCENIPGSYYCTCPRGYILLSDSKTCHYYNPCMNPSDCSHGCIETSGGPTCYCPEGSVLADDGKTCTGCSSPDNGGCSQICVTLRPGLWECDCYPGYKLQPDKKRCLALGPRPYLIYSNLRDIRRMNFDGTQHRSLFDSQMGRVFALDYDPVDNRIYFAHTALKWIESANIDGSYREKIISETLEMPEGLCIDAINRKMYWTDRGKSSIERSDLNGKNRENIIQENRSYQPRGIAVHPMAKKLFWTDIGTSPRIESSNLEGSERVVLFSTDLVWPSGITVEFLSSRLYWCDTKRSVIESSHLDGSGRRTISQNEVGHPFAIAVFEDHIWITDWLQPSITRMDKKNTKNVVHLRGNMQRPTSVVVVHPLTKPAILDDISQAREKKVVRNETAKSDSFFRGPLSTSMYATGEKGDRWSGDTLVTEIVVADEGGCTESHCDINAHCVPSEDGPRCQCVEGFTGNGQSCQDIDECILHVASCDLNHTDCINTEGGYICKCRAGFLGNGDQCLDIDEHRLGNQSCGGNYQCINTEGNSTCTCANALTGTELSPTESSVSASTSMVSTNNTSRNKNHRECPASHDGYCLNGGECFHLVEIEDYGCRCVVGYIGERCQEWWEPYSRQMKIRSVTISVSLIVLLLVLGLASFAIYYYSHQMNHRKRPYKPEDATDATRSPISNE
ncbi:pro-epidermal growth factor [Spea bombifrons]|uniref:pro-epidermal growth factor n=1 Tax=Spea bombifrons TaxID=233779 RepID=UPI00234B7537|nr:pro-epidermal growth factor [Spea bombifrons]